MNKMRTIVSGIWKMAVDWFDPVCQNPDAILYGEYRGFVVQLAPKYGTNGHIDSWVQRKAECEEVDKAIAEEEAEKAKEEKAVESEKDDPGLAEPVDLAACPGL